MSPGPENETAAAAARRGRLLASHADRDQVIDVLKAAFVQGHLTKDEFDLRVGQTFVSRPMRDWPRSPPTSPLDWPETSRRARPPRRRAGRR
jgi:hypothetical protein